MSKSPCTKKRPLPGCRLFREHQDLLDENFVPASRFGEIDSRFENLELRLAQIEDVVLRKNPDGQTTIGAEGNPQ